MKQLRVISQRGAVPLACAVFFFVQTFSVNASVPVEKLTTEQILARHLESIGTADARKAVTSIMATGSARALVRGRSTGEASGAVVFASEGEMNLIGMSFPNIEYPAEKVGFDGKDLTVGFLQPGQRTILGNFIRLNEETFKSGILGGTLSTAWEMNQYDVKTGRLKCGGTKKIDGAEHYKCQYSPRKSDMSIAFYFNAQTFRHVRTEYKRVISSSQGTTIDNSARQHEFRYALTEDFSEYKVVNKLTLPHQYVVSLETITGTGSTSMEWSISLNEFTFNQSFAPSVFKVDAF